MCAISPGRCAVRPWSCTPCRSLTITGQDTRIDDLTEREREVLELIARGLRNEDIAQQLAITTKTVRNHITSIFSKLAASTRAQVIVRAREVGFGYATH